MGGAVDDAHPAAGDQASIRYPATSSSDGEVCHRAVISPGGVTRDVGRGPTGRPRHRSAGRLPVDHRPETCLLLRRSRPPGLRPLARLIAISWSTPWSSITVARPAAVGGEDRVGLRAVGQFGQLPRAAGADPLLPEAAVAAEDQRAALRRDVFDVGRADAFDQRLTLVPSASSCRCRRSRRPLRTACRG